MKSRVVRGAVVALVVLPVASGAARAQSATALVIEPGTELRLTPRRAGAPTVRGRVVVLARDTIVLRVDEARERVALRDLSALEVRGGEDKRRGVLIGAGIATGITALFGGIDAARGTISGGDLVGTILGNAVIGGLVGYAFAPAGWERLPLPAEDRP